VLIIACIINCDILLTISFDRVEKRWNCISNCQISCCSFNLVVSLVKSVSIIDSVEYCGLNMATVIIYKSNFKVVITSCGHNNILSVQLRIESYSSECNTLICCIKRHVQVISFKKCIHIDVINC